MPCPDAISWYECLIITQMIFLKQTKIRTQPISWTRFSLIMQSTNSILNAELGLRASTMQSAPREYSASGAATTRTTAIEITIRFGYLSHSVDNCHHHRQCRCRFRAWNEPTHHCEIQNIWHFFGLKMISSVGCFEFPISRASDYFHLKIYIGYPSLPHLFRINSYNDDVITTSINICRYTSSHYQLPHIGCRACACVPGSTRTSVSRDTTTATYNYHN